MRDIEPAQRFLRQQVSYAQLLHGLAANDGETKVFVNALRRAVLQSLDLGWLVYLRAVFPHIAASSLNQYVGAVSTHAQGGLVAELESLLTSGTWLVGLAQAIESLTVEKPQENLNSPGTISETASLLIARSGLSASTMHWSQLKASEVYRWVENSRELIERHYASNHEY